MYNLTIETEKQTIHYQGRDVKEVIEYILNYQFYPDDNIQQIIIREG